MADGSAIPGLSGEGITRLRQLCLERHIVELRIFGSVARGDQTEVSDVDVLVRFKPGVDPDLFELGELQQELSEVFEREVDLKTPDMFSEPHLRRVLASSKLGYAA